MDDNEIRRRVLEAYRTKAISLEGARLATIPSQLNELQHNLKALSLYRNHFEVVPEQIFSFTALEQLSLARNLISTIPSKISVFSHLKMLNFSSNKLTNIEPLFTLTTLEELDVSNNAIDSISNNISTLKQLRDLKIFRNQLKGLPAGIGALVRLKKLDASHNQLISLPSQLLYLTSLVVFNVTENPLRVPPIDVIKRGRVAIQNYLRGDLTDPKQCVALGAGLSHCVVNIDTAFTIKAINRSGAPKRGGGDEFVVKFVPVKTESTSQPSFVITLSPPATEHISDANTGITSSPTTSNISPQTSNTSEETIAITTKTVTETIQSSTEVPDTLTSALVKNDIKSASETSMDTKNAPINVIKISDVWSEPYLDSSKNITRTTTELEVVSEERVTDSSKTVTEVATTSPEDSTVATSVVSENTLETTKEGTIASKEVTTNLPNVVTETVTTSSEQPPDTSSEAPKMPTETTVSSVLSQPISQDEKIPIDGTKVLTEDSNIISDRSKICEEISIEQPKETATESSRNLSSEVMASANKDEALVMRAQQTSLSVPLDTNLSQSRSLENVSSTQPNDNERRHHCHHRHHHRHRPESRSKKSSTLSDVKHSTSMSSKEKSTKSSQSMKSSDKPHTKNRKKSAVDSNSKSSIPLKEQKSPSHAHDELTVPKQPNTKKSSAGHQNKRKDKTLKEPREKESSKNATKDDSGIDYSKSPHVETAPTPRDRSFTETTWLPTTPVQSSLPRQGSFLPPLKMLENVDENADVPGTVRGKVVDNFDGTYTVTYRLTTLGLYKVHITLYGVHIRGSPFDLTAGSDLREEVERLTALSNEQASKYAQLQQQLIAMKTSYESQLTELERQLAEKTQQCRMLEEEIKKLSHEKEELLEFRKQLAAATSELREKFIKVRNLSSVRERTVAEEGEGDKVNAEAKSSKRLWRRTKSRRKVSGDHETRRVGDLKRTESQKTSTPRGIPQTNAHHNDNNTSGSFNTSRVETNGGLRRQSSVKRK